MKSQSFFAVVLVLLSQLALIGCNGPDPMFPNSNPGAYPEYATNSSDSDAYPYPSGGDPDSGKTTPGGIVQDAEEQAFLTLINQHRADNGLAPLALSKELTDAARWLSQDMAAQSYLNHTDSLGRDPSSRIDAFNYDTNRSAWGENIACGNSSATKTFQQWLNSPGHNANMLGANFRLIGIARAYDTSSQYGWYWTTDFGN